MTDERSLVTERSPTKHLLKCYLLPHFITRVAIHRIYTLAAQNKALGKKKALHNVHFSFGFGIYVTSQNQTSHFSTCFYLCTDCKLQL